MGGTLRWTSHSRRFERCERWIRIRATPRRNTSRPTTLSFTETAITTGGQRLGASFPQKAQAALAIARTTFAGEPARSRRLSHPRRGLMLARGRRRLEPASSDVPQPEDATP